MELEHFINALSDWMFIRRRSRPAQLSKNLTGRRVLSSGNLVHSSGIGAHWRNGRQRLRPMKW